MLYKARFKQLSGPFHLSIFCSRPSIHQQKAVEVRALTTVFDDFDEKSRLFDCREDIDAAGLHCGPGFFGMAALTNLNRAI